MYHYYVDEISSIYSGWSASSTSWCEDGETTTDDESDNNKEEQPAGKKQKFEVQAQRRSKRLKDIAQKQAKIFECDSHPSQTVKKTKAGGRQRKQQSGKARPADKGEEQKKDSETGY